MFVLLDVIVIAIIVFCVIRSAKKGFVCILIEVVGFVAAVFLAVSLSAPLAEYTYKYAIEDKIVDSVSETQSDKSDKIIDDIFDAVPSFIKDSSFSSDVTKEKITEKFNSAVNDGVKTATKKTSDAIVKPAAVKLLGMVYSTVMFIILLIVVKLLAKVINKLFSFSIIGAANKFLGALIGIPKGILIAIAFCFVITLLVSFAGGKFLIFTQESINKSVLVDFLAKASPFNR